MSFSYFAVVVFFVMLTFINLNFYNLQLFSFGACVFLAIQQMKISDEAYYWSNQDADYLPIYLLFGNEFCLLADRELTRDTNVFLSRYFSSVRWHTFDVEIQCNPRMPSTSGHNPTRAPNHYNLQLSDFAN